MAKYKSVLEFKAWLLGGGSDRSSVDHWIPSNIFTNDFSLEAYLYMVDNADDWTDSEKVYVRRKASLFLLQTTPPETWEIETSHFRSKSF